MRRILVTAISGDIGNGILKILKENGETVFGCDVNAYAAGMDITEQFWQCPYAVDTAYPDWLLDTCTQNKIGYIIPTNEREIERLDPVRERFLAAGIKLMIQSPEVLALCLDKHKTACFLKETGLDAPDSRLEPGMLEPDRLYISKPCRSNGSKNIRIADGKSFMRTGIPEGCVLQEYIDDAYEYTIGLFRNEQITNVIVFRRELKNGYSYLVELVTDPAFTELANKVADAIHLQGYINIQLRRKNGKNYIFEINPRISGTVRFRDMLGFRDVLWWLDLLDGNPAPRFINEYKEAVGIRELNEKFVKTVRA